MAHPDGLPVPEFSRLVRADAVQAREVVETIVASPAECRALAERFELEAIERFTATVRLRRVRGGTMIRAGGDFDADVVQTCVATLESVPAHVADRIDALFAPPELIAGDEDEEELVIDPEAIEDESPEPIQDGRIDIGELAAQHLSLALDPYPRAPDAVFEPIEEHPAPAEDAETFDTREEEERPSPFAGLAKLKRPE